MEPYPPRISLRTNRSASATPPQGGSVSCSFIDRVKLSFIGGFSTAPHWSELILLPSFRRMLVATDRLTRADWNATSHDVQKDGLKEDKSKSKRQIPWIPASAGMTNQNRQTLPHWSRQTLAPHSRLTFISRQTLPHWSGLTKRAVCCYRNRRPEAPEDPSPRRNA